MVDMPNSVFRHTNGLGTGLIHGLIFLFVSLSPFLIGVRSQSFPPCSTAGNCSSHAIAVVNATPDFSVCNCSCADQWSGSTCGVCPVNYNQTTCNACAPGYNTSTFPNCTIINRPCTIQQDCNTDFTASAKGNTSTNCTCVCKGGTRAVQPHCDCPSKYDQTTCMSCAHGYDQKSYPNCYALCNITQVCPANAGSVTGNVVQGCNCICNGGWTGPNCTVCPPNWDRSLGCAVCALGYQLSAGNCYACSNAANCSSQGTATLSSPTNCSCECAGNWTGATCNYCPPQYDSSNGCYGCNTTYGFQDVNGDCMPMCTAFENCSNHASDPVFTFPSTETCNCVCATMWNGTNCSTCPFPYDASKNCNDCLPGFHGFPNCTNATTTTLPPTTTTAMPSTTTAVPTSTTAMPTSTTPPPSTTVAPTTLPPAKKNRTHTRTHSMTDTSTVTMSNTHTVSNTLSHSRKRSTTEMPSRTRPTQSLSISFSDMKTESRSRLSKTANLTVSGSWTNSATSTFSTSMTLSNTSSSSPSDSSSASLCANTVDDCTQRTANSMPTSPPVECHCICRNMWSTMFCNYCHWRYNVSADCGECLRDTPNRTFVIYPRCDYILYISGNLSVVLFDPRLEFSMVRDAYFTSLAADISIFVNSTLRCAKYASNISAYVTRWTAGGLFEIDIEVLDQSVENATIAASCALDGLKNRLRLLNFSLSAEVAARVGGTPRVVNNSTVMNPFFDLTSTQRSLTHGGNATQINPCDPYWCSTIPPIRDPEVINWTWLIATASVIGALLVLGLSYYFLWHRPRELFRRQYVYRKGNEVEFRRFRDVTQLEMEWVDQNDQPVELKSATDSSVAMNSASS